MNERRFEPARRRPKSVAARQKRGAATAKEKSRRIFKLAQIRRYRDGEFGQKP
jgi:hypothetical protein